MNGFGSSLNLSDVDGGWAGGAASVRVLWVSAAAAPGGDGSAGSPFSTIQAAVNVATPGTAIMVQAGTYVENVKFPSNTGGNATSPIQLISADGQGAAKVVAADNSISTIKGLGVHDIVVKGFEVEGGLNGIQFSQSGSDFTHLVSNIVVQGNIISNTVQDGVKISQGVNVRILDNTIAHTGGEGIDFVAVNDSIMARNDVSFVQGAAGVFAKGGSTNVLITQNTVHNIVKDGIEIGGWTTDAYFRPGFDSYEAKDVTVSDNIVSGVGQRTVNILGALNSEVSHNQLQANSSYQTAIGIGAGADKTMVSVGVDISGNVVTNAPAKLYVLDAGSSGATVHDNALSGSLGLHGGPLAAWVTAESLSVATATGGAVPTPAQASSAPAPTIDGVSIYNGTSKSETLIGTGLHNALYGGGGNDSLVGGDQADTLDGGIGVDTLVGGAGDDSYVVSSLSDTLVEQPGGGTDTVYTTLTTVRLPWANVENAVFTGNAAANIVGNELDNSLVGGSFNDSIDGGAGADTLIGGLGDDIYFVHDGRTQIIEYAGGGTDTVRSDVSFVLSANVENLLLLTPGLTGVGNDLDNKITGTAGADVMYGGAGADTLTGNDGSDTLDGGFGADMMVGGKGDDVYFVDNVGDRIVENAGEGTDTVYTSLDAYVLVPNIENLTGVRDGPQDLTGNTLANVITGSDDADTLHGGGGADTLIGGLGGDVYYVEDAREKVVEAPGGGYDTVIVANGAWAPDAGQAIEKIVAADGSNNISLHGNEFAQLLVGNAGANVIDGGGGADTMQGGAGNDTYIVDDARDVVVEAAGEGVDTVKASVDFHLSPNVEALILTAPGHMGVGNDLDNTITGTAGADTLAGGGGADTLTGGDGPDVFAFGHIADVGDTITDFQIGIDKLNVQGLLSELGPSASLSYGHTAAGLNVYVDHDGAHDLLVSLKGVAGASLSTADFDSTILSLDTPPPSATDPVSPGAAPASSVQASDMPLNLDDRAGVFVNGKASYTVDQAAAQLDRAGLSWSDQLGQGATVTYAFRASAPTTMPSGVTGFTQLSSAQIAGAELSLAAWSDVANINFVRVGSGTTGATAYSNDATILFSGYASGPDNAAAFTYLPGSTRATAIDGDVWIATNDPDNTSPAAGSYGLETLTHEIGHAIGLSHPSDYDAGDVDQDITYAANASYYEDSREYSLMSYFASSNTGGSASIFAVAPQLDDIAAAQRLYGANYAVRAGDDTYGFHSNLSSDGGDRPWYELTTASDHFYAAIWDGAGDDTLDFSLYSANQLIDLRQGNFSNVGGDVGNLAIAAGAQIENAIGGGGADTLIGNELDNRLYGGGGDDRLQGGSGADSLYGGDGQDTAVFAFGLGGAAATPTADGLVVGSGGDRDLVVGVETLQFADGSISVPWIGVVDAAYEAYLGRLAAPLELAPWTNGFSTGGSSVADLRQSLFNTAGLAHASITVAWLFETFGGRAPSAQETSVWVTKLESGVSLAQAIADFAGTPDAAAHETELVGSLYVSYLGRAPVSSEVSVWASALSTGGVTGDELRARLLFDPAGQIHTAGVVGELYADYLGRAAAPVEIANWSAAVEAGVEFTQIRGTLLTDPAGQQHTALEISDLYNEYLGRAPAQVEIAAWAGGVASGLDFDMVRASLVTGTLGGDHAAAELGGLYETYLGRSVTSVEVDNWRGGLAGGWTFDQIRTSLVQSTAGMSHSADTIADLYQSYLGRAAAPVEIGNWQGGLAGGWTFDQIRTALLQSATGTSHTASVITDLYHSYLGRDPAPVEIANWSGGVRGGLAFTQVADSLATFGTEPFVHHLNGTAQADVFDFGTTAGHLVVADFDPAADHVRLLGLSSFDALAHAQQVFGSDGQADVLVAYDSADTLLLKHVMLSALDTGDFLHA